MFLNPNIFSNFNYNCSNFLDLKNLQEQVKKAFRINCSSDLKNFANSRLSAHSGRRYYIDLLLIKMAVVAMFQENWSQIKIPSTN